MKKHLYLLLGSLFSFTVSASYFNLEDTLSFEKQPCNTIQECSILAQRGNLRAYVVMGIMYIEGLGGVKENTKLGVNWVREAANKDYPMAQAVMGILYTLGDGVKADKKLAFDWMQKAALQGFAMAQNSVGVMYRDGLGVSRNDKLAVYWFKQAAARNNGDGMHNLGMMYLEGRGIRLDVKRGKAWIARAAKRNQQLRQQQIMKYYEAAAPQ